MRIEFDSGDNLFPKDYAEMLVKYLEDKGIETYCEEVPINKEILYPWGGTNWTFLVKTKKGLNKKIAEFIRYPIGADNARTKIICYNKNLFPKQIRNIMAETHK